MAYEDIYQLYEGTDEQCDSVQKSRELTWVTNIGPSGSLRYLTNDGVVRYIYSTPISGDVDL